jgi:hypothetical protein
MLDLNKVVVNNTKKRQMDNLSKVRGGDRLVTDIQMPVSSGDRGANLPKIEFFDAVAHLEVGLA